jgi:hypothetical protein
MLEEASQPMTESMRQSLVRLRQGLLALHKLLLDHETVAYERIHGRVPKLELLGLVLHHERFAWLRPISGLIAQMDHLLDAEEPPSTEEDARRLFGRARALLRPEEAGAGFGRKYLAALQSDPDVILSHAAVSRLIAGGP